MSTLNIPGWLSWSQTQVFHGRGSSYKDDGLSNLRTGRSAFIKENTVPIF